MSTGRPPLVEWLTILLTALALVPAGAHLAALPNKIGLDREAYLTVQGIYQGWALFGVVWIGALLGNLALAWLLRGQPWPAGLALLAALLLALGLVIFFLWIYPANQATANWTRWPEAPAWHDLRRQWEYGHAVNALLTLAAFGAATLAVLLDRARGSV